jgi:tRNA 2-thiouridine synthesizing protein A
LNADVESDLRGKKCPMTFVYTKIALEEMKSGEILKIILDFPPAFVNVPKSVKIQELGTIIDEKEEGEDKIFWIKKT